LLRDAGHDAIAVDLPGEDPAAGLPEYARLVASAIEGRSDVVLAAQSLGGFTAPLVPALSPVTEIVFVNAMIPVPGETAGTWWEKTGQQEARLAAAERYGYPTEIDLATYFLHDVPAAIAAEGEPYQRGEADAAFESVCDFGAWPDIPLRVASGAADRLFPVEFQRQVARDRLGIEADVLPGGHLMALSEPEALVRYLLDTRPV